MRKHENLLGRTSGITTVIDDNFKSKKGIRMVTIKCKCGTIKEVRAYSVTSGRLESCGCLRAQHLKESAIKHRASKETWYNSWRNMLGRTQNPNDVAYDRYKDVYVDPRYLEDPWAFFNDIEGTKIDNSYTVDRIDGSKGYEPGNMRWASKIEQVNNRGISHNVDLRNIYPQKSGKYDVVVQRKGTKLYAVCNSLEEAQTKRSELKARLA